MQGNGKENITTASSDVQGKRAQLVNAERNLQVGRREAPEPYDPRPKRMMYARGIALGAVVVVAAVALILVCASGVPLG